MATTTWVIDPSHSEISFKVRHLMINTVTGKFNDYTATVETEENDFHKAKVSFTAQVASITTGNEQRDQHLVSPDFFDAPGFPELTFVGTRTEDVDNDGSYSLYGDITIKGVTKNIKLSVEFGGVVVDPWGNTKAGVTINGVINRRDFGLTWGAVTEAGAIVVSDEVKLHLEVQLLKQV